MKVKLHAWLMWDAVQYNDVNFHEDRRVLVIAISPFTGDDLVLADKETTKDAWYAIVMTCIGSAHRATQQKLC